MTSMKSNKYAAASTYPVSTNKLYCIYFVFDGTTV